MTILFILFLLVASGTHAFATPVEWPVAHPNTVTIRHAERLPSDNGVNAPSEMGVNTPSENGINTPSDTTAWQGPPDHTAAIAFLRKFSDLSADIPRERVFLHTDRPWYFHGDRIWFSAYITAGHENRLSSISRVLHVELVTPDGAILERHMIGLENGRGSGYLSTEGISPEIGAVRINAYTLWARNFAGQYDFSAERALLRPDTPATAATSARPGNPAPYEPSAEAASAETLPFRPDLQFLPEGGQLLHNVPGRLAFKAVGPDGLGVHVSGIIRDDRGNEIPFASDWLGMGAVDVTLSADRTYTASIGAHTFALPIVQRAGLQMRVNPEPAVLRVQLQARHGATSEVKPVEEVFIFAHVRGNAYRAAVVVLLQGSGETLIPRELLPTGIVHITAVDAGGFPVAERLVFNRNALDVVSVDLAAPAAVRTRGLIDLGMTVRDASGDLLPASVSVAVFDDAIANVVPGASDIRSRMYLESELGSYVEQPGYYFSTAAEADRHLDLLLLTQGWRAYDMRAIAEMQQLALDWYPEQGITVSGLVRSGVMRRPLANIPVAIGIGDAQQDVNLVDTDAEGRFYLTGMDFNGSQRVVLRASSPRRRDNVLISLDNQDDRLPRRYEPFAPKWRDLASPLPRMPEVDAEGLTPGDRIARAQQETDRFLEAQLFAELDELVVTSTSARGDREDEWIRTTSRRSQAVDLDRDAHLVNLPIFAILNQMPGVSATPTSISVSTGFSTLSTALPPPVIIVDGVQSDYDLLRSLSTADIQTIHVYRRSDELGFFGVSGAGGVISVRTRTGVVGGNNAGMVAVQVPGYQVPRQFYAPLYRVTHPLDHPVPDPRVSLYWVPVAELSLGTTSLRFAANDVPSRYRIVVQGVTESGVPFLQEATFVIEF
jgi:hypothetical protein